ncbi:hypothetical protein AB1K42_24795 [Roseibium algicola]|uniref:hypothetical protein n=1 Tax=Roseibium algicola TaxID=2857014 RepID=UPI003457F284
MISYSGTSLTISETLETNSIVWIHSLPENEMGPTRRILEDLEGLSIADGFQLIEHSAGNRAEFESVLSKLTTDAADGLRPILHVDAHGTADEGLLFAPSGDRMSWIEIIGLLRGLNVATANNLTCVFALCFGLHLYKQVSLMEPVPAYLFIAPPSEISVGFLEAQTLAFYREINRTNNVTAAFQSTLDENMALIHCQGLLFQSLLRYIFTYCKGRERRKRQEQLVTAILKRNNISKPSIVQLKAVRQAIRVSLKPGQKLIDQFAPEFLINRCPAFEYADLDTALHHSKEFSRSNRAR